MAGKYFKSMMNEIVGSGNEDYDKMFSYYTKRQVNILDRWLGITNYFVMLLIAAYVVGFVFILDRGYLESEPAFGPLVTHVSGDAVAFSQGKKAGSRYFSGDELTYPGLERGNVFVATKIVITEQKRDVCEDFSKYCMSADDCSKDVSAECTSNRRCKEPSWCPVMKGEDIQQEVYKVKSGEIYIWIKSAIQFQQLAPERLYTDDMNPIVYPKPGFNTITLRQILLECNPPVRYEEVAELGAAIEVQLVWNCVVDMPGCERKMFARRIDTLLDEDKIGFNFGWPQYMGEDFTVNSELRELKEMYGIRIYFRSVGTGQKVSFAAIIFKMSTGMALLGFAPIIADLVMLNCFKLSKKYAARKYITTIDFSDHFDKLEEVESSDEEMADADEAEDEQEDEAWRQKMDEEDEDNAGR